MIRKLFCVLLILIIMPIEGNALQYYPFRLWVSPSGEMDEQAILWTQVENNMYLFLPGNAEKDQLKIGFTREESITLNGEDITSGISASILKDENEIQAGKEKKHLTVMQGSKNLPAIYITTESGNLNTIHQHKTKKEAGWMIMIDGNGETAYDGKLTYLKMRGNSSTSYPKKNYQMKLEQGTNLLGMGKARKWILTANYIDKSLLRTQFSFDMAAYAGLPFVPEHQESEVYLNHEYNGLYLFCEKIEIDDDRIDIKDLEEETENLNEQELKDYPMVGRTGPVRGGFKAYKIPNIPEDVTGGYLIEYESLESRYKQAASAYQTTRGINLVIKSPEYCSEEQMAYISRFMQGFENAVFSKDGKDPETGKHFSEFVDLNSLVCKYLLDEISKNYDGNFSSQYFFKPEDSKSEIAFAGPPWDLDNSYADYARENNIKKITRTDNLYIGGPKGGAYWWPALYRQKDFYTEMVRQYQEKYVPAIEILLGEKKDEKGQLKSLDEYEAMIRESAEMEYAFRHGMRQMRFFIQTGQNLQENIEYLKIYLRKRKAFLDQEWLEDAVPDS